LCCMETLFGASIFDLIEAGSKSFRGILAREEGFEPSTCGFGIRCSTTELHSRVNVNWYLAKESNLAAT
jgi:hypothetical protein